jgi:hypothetical protein
MFTCVWSVVPAGRVDASRYQRDAIDKQWIRPVKGLVKVIYDARLMLKSVVSRRWKLRRTASGCARW